MSLPNYRFFVKMGAYSGCATEHSVVAERHTRGRARRTRSRPLGRHCSHQRRQGPRASLSNSYSTLFPSQLNLPIEQIHVEQLSIFLLRDGTVLSFCQDPGQHARYSSIFDRVQSASNLIRETEDPSFVLQALLDVVADHALEIVDEFRDQITKLESHVLARPVS